MPRRDLNRLSGTSNRHSRALSQTSLNQVPALSAPHAPSASDDPSQLESYVPSGHRHTQTRQISQSFGPPSASAEGLATGTATAQTRPASSHSYSSSMSLMHSSTYSLSSLNSGYSSVPSPSARGNNYSTVGLRRLFKHPSQFYQSGSGTGGLSSSDLNYPYTSDEPFSYSQDVVR